MIEFEIPCPVCCKHIKIDKEEFQKGGTFKCKSCGRSIKVPARKKEGTKDSE